MGAGLSGLTRIDRFQISIAFGSLAVYWLIYRTLKDRGGESVTLHPTQLQPFQDGPAPTSDITNYPSRPEITSTDRSRSATYRHTNARSSNSVRENYNKLTHNPVPESSFDSICEVNRSRKECHHHYALPEEAAPRKRSKGCQTRGTIKMSVKHSGNRQIVDNVQGRIKLPPSKNVGKKKEIKDVNIPKEADLEDEELLLKNEILSKYSLDPAKQSVFETGVSSLDPSSKLHYLLQNSLPSVHSTLSAKAVNNTPFSNSSRHEDFDDCFKKEILVVNAALPVVKSFRNIQPSTTLAVEAVPSEQTTNDNTVEYLQNTTFEVPSTLPIIESHSNVQPPPPSGSSKKEERDEGERELVIEEWMKSEILSDDSRLELFGNVQPLLSSICSTTMSDLSQTSCNINEFNGSILEGSLPVIGIESRTKLLFLPPLVSSLPTISDLPGVMPLCKYDNKQISTDFRNNFTTESLTNVLETSSSFSLTPITSLPDVSVLSKYDEESFCEQINTEFRSNLATESLEDILSPPSLFTLTSAIPTFPGTLTLDKYTDECFLHGVNTDSSNDSIAELLVNVPTPPPLFSSKPVLPGESSKTKNTPSKYDDIEACLEEISTVAEHRNEPSKQTLTCNQAHPPKLESNTSFTIPPAMRTKYTDSLFSIPTSNSSLGESLIMVKPPANVKDSDKSFGLRQPKYAEPVSDNPHSVTRMSTCSQGNDLKPTSIQTTAMGSKKSTVCFLFPEAQGGMTEVLSSKHKECRFGVDIDRAPPIKELYSQGPMSSYNEKRPSSQAEKDLIAVFDYDTFPEVPLTKTKEVKESKVELLRGNHPRNKVQSRPTNLIRGKAVNLLGPIHTRKLTPLSTQSKENVATEHNRNTPNKIIIESQADQKPSVSKRKTWRK